MADSTTKAPGSLRSLVFVIAGSATYFLTLFLVLYVLDRQVYTTAKQDIIRDNFWRMFDLPDELRDASSTALYGLAATDRASAQQNLRKSMQKIVNGSTSMYRMELRDANDAVVEHVENASKLRSYNTFRNNLFLRSFGGRTSLSVRSPLHTGQERGLLVGYYTSPKDYAPIEKLTERYRWIATLIVALWIAVYWFLYQYLLRPMRHVTAYLERSSQGPPGLILKARGDLESGYNELAARALLQMMEERLSAPTRPEAADEARDRARAVGDALKLAAEAFSVEKIAAAELASQDDQWTISESFSPDTQLEPVKDAELLSTLSAVEQKCPAGQLPSDGHFAVQEDEQGFTYCAPLPRQNLLLITGKLQANAPGLRFRLHGLQRACNVIRRGFISYQEYREGIFRQRSEANILLSRNLGHDLTNIIATSKLDLMAVRRLLDTSASAGDGPRAQLLRQSVAGVLESTRFLQEIVNIYRSLSNVKKPQFERRDLKGLVEEFLGAFEPSISGRVEIRRELDTPMPAPIVEPRLLKLALFNVLTNALDALKRTIGNAQGDRVTVRLLYEEKSHTYQIDVEDSGPGIRDAEGRLLSPAEIQSIFEYGYSTKSESSEGLGLSWVRTIMRDFHDGKVSAENLPQGGARFSLILHSMERSEAKVG